VAFLQIPDIIEKIMVAVPFIPKPSLEDYQQTDREAREVTKRCLNVE
jgi:1-deoxy-D-xylulose 5-phosphate reductoisomerase